MSQPNQVSTTASLSERWTAYLDGSPAGLEVPADSPVRLGANADVDVMSMIPTEDVRDGVARLVDVVACPLEVVVLAVWAAMVSRYSGQEDVLIGRADDHSPRAEILRIATPPDGTFRDLCSVAAQAVANAKSLGHVHVHELLEFMRAEPPRAPDMIR